MSQFTTDRRTIVKGAAWTVPAISVAAAAPSLAASPEPTALHDLSTSVPGTGTRTSATEIEITPTNFINTGTETVEGITVVFSASDGQTIDDILISGLRQPIENIAQGATISGEGTSTVTLVLAPGAGLGQVTIEPDDNYQAPLGQILVLGSAIPFTLSTTVSASNAAAGDVPFENSTEVPAA